MTCPVCGYDNLEGVDNCENCGADLRTVDIPHPSDEFEARLVRDHLAALDSDAPVFVSPDDAIGETIRRMQERAFGVALAVVEGDRLVGIFTERDALLKVAGRPLDGVRVRDVMTPDPVVLRDEDNIAVALHKMAVGGFRHIPLLEDGRISRVVSAPDLFRHILRILDDPRRLPQEAQEEELISGGQVEVGVAQPVSGEPRARVQPASGETEPGLASSR